jgi:hypothetical protein
VWKNYDGLKCDAKGCKGTLRFAWGEYGVAYRCTHDHVYWEWPPAPGMQALTSGECIWEVPYNDVARDREGKPILDKDGNEIPVKRTRPCGKPLRRAGRLYYCAEPHPLR